MSNYIDLKINGRLFPSWILLNFGKYKLPPELKSNENEDLCLRKTKNKLREYQEFITKYMDFRSSYKNILLYHGMGSGKTTTAINVYNMLYNYTPDWNKFILLPASLHSTWDEELLNHPRGLGLDKSEIKRRYANIKFIHYDSPFAHKKFLDTIKESDSSKKNIFIFDEVHNFINNVYNNVTSNKGGRAYVIYDYIIQAKLEDNDIRVMLLTGTPAVNNPFELALMFNLLRPGTFPDSETKFMDKYVTNNALKVEKVNMFQRRIMGLISYYGAQSKKLYAEKRKNDVNLVMSKYQNEVYDHFEYVENKLEKKNQSKPKSKGSKVSSTYRSFTRSSCNFTFPVMTDKLTGENRPRPSNFRVSEKEAQKILEGRQNKEDKDKSEENTVDYLDMIKLYLVEFKKFLKKEELKDKSQNLSIQKDIEIFKKQYNGDFKKFWKEYKKKSNIVNAMYRYSCKMTAIIFNSSLSKGPLIVFSNYVRMEGLEVFKIYLRFAGFSQYSPGSGKDYYRYTEYHGSVSTIDRAKNRKAFNTEHNIDGKVIKIILISPAGSEGISLRNVRQVHILEPYWNEIRIEQLIARAVRQCSHEDLPMKERYVDIYRYYAGRANEKTTADQDIRRLAYKKKKLIDSFLVPIKQVAVDCELNKEHNTDNVDEYTCFRFNQASLFDKKIGPAYKKDEFYDAQIDNGLNSINSRRIKVKVKEILAVKRTGSDSYTEPVKYWYNMQTGVVYDYDLDFPIGKVFFDSDGLPDMKSENVYVISKLIPIPQLKFYQ